MSKAAQKLQPTVTVVGGGVAGLSAACALAEAGCQVQLVERRGYLGGRATSFLNPTVGEVIDNCQHVLFGCCTNLLGFYRRIGTESRIHWSNAMVMIEPGGRRSWLGASSLPAPFHGLPRLITAKAFSFSDKLALARALTGLMRPIPADTQENLAAWLARHGQTRELLNRFWHPVIASALNSDLDAIALPYAAKVVRELFLNSAEAGRMGLSTVPLGDLYTGAADLLRRTGSSVHFNAKIDSASWSPESGQWTVAGTAGNLTSDYLILALSFEAMARLLPRLPPAEGAAGLATQLAKHRHWPICSAHLWFDREITDLEHAALLDRGIHWMFNKGRLQPWRRCPGSYLEVVVSGSRSFAALAGEQAIARVVAELGEYFPEVRSARLEKSVFIKETGATFGVPPGVDAWRPGATAPWPNCFLAGDWIATGWPSTMESAARSGHLAAEALCGKTGGPRNFLEPDLKPKGLMRIPRL